MQDQYAAVGKDTLQFLNEAREAMDSAMSADHEQELLRPMPEKARRLPRQQPVVKAAKVGRNQPCPCGSGAKFKRCCIGEWR